jgi:hypothetical protein
MMMIDFISAVLLSPHGSETSFRYPFPETAPQGRHDSDSWLAYQLLNGIAYPFPIKGLIVCRKKIELGPRTQRKIGLRALAHPGMIEYAVSRKVRCSRALRCPAGSQIKIQRRNIP